MITQDSAPGTYLLTTASGSYYEVVVAPEGHTLTRLPKAEAPNLALADEGQSLRQDRERLGLIEFQAEEGAPAAFLLEGLGELPYTLRQTTTVASIVKTA